MKSILNFFLLCFIIKILNILGEPLVLNFKTRIIKGNNVMESLINNDIYTNILIGEKKQIIEMNIKSQQGSTFVVSDSCTQNTKATKFKEKESSTYKEYMPSTTHYMYEFKDAALASDNFIFFQSNNKEILVKDYKFMNAQSLWYDYQEHLGGLIGLKLQEKTIDQPKPPELTDFIDQLKEKNIINSYVFVLDYKDNDSGTFYVGDYFHDFDESYSSNDFISAKTGKEIQQVKNWEISADKILHNNQIIQNKTYIQFYYELGIVAAPQTFREYINSTFFKSYYDKKICKEVVNMENIASFKKYTYIECDKNGFDKKSFPELIFYNGEMGHNFTLNYEDLFYEDEKKIYFLVIFPVYYITVDYWLMGKPFIKKYKLFLDKDNKKIGLYLNRQEYKPDEPNNNNNNNKNKNNTTYIIIIIVLAVVLIISIVSLLYYFLVIKRQRRIRANELEENIDYETVGDDQEKNENIIND